MRPKIISNIICRIEKMLQRQLEAAVTSNGTLGLKLMLEGAETE